MDNIKRRNKQKENIIKKERKNIRKDGERKDGGRNVGE